MARRGRRGDRRNAISELKERNETERRNDDTATGSFPQVRGRKGKAGAKGCIGFSCPCIFRHSHHINVRSARIRLHDPDQ